MIATNRITLCGLLVSSPEPFGKRGRVQFEVAGFAKGTNAQDNFFHLVVQIKSEKMPPYKKGDVVYIEGRLGDHRKGGIIFARTVKDYLGKAEIKSKDGINGLCHAHNKAVLKGHVGNLEGDHSKGFFRGSVATDGKTETVWHKIFFVRGANEDAFDALQAGDLVEVEGPVLGHPEHHNLRADRLQVLRSKGSPPPAVLANLHGRNESRKPSQEGTGCMVGLLSLLLPQRWRMVSTATLSKK